MKSLILIKIQNLKWVESSLAHGGVVGGGDGGNFTFTHLDITLSSLLVSIGGIDEILIDKKSVGGIVHNYCSSKYHRH